MMKCVKFAFWTNSHAELRKWIRRFWYSMEKLCTVYNKPESEVLERFYDRSKEDHSMKRF